MQSNGGYKYPSGAICIVLSVIVLTITVILVLYTNCSVGCGLTLFLSLEGTVLLASSLTPIGLAPPPQGLFGKIKWFFKQQGGIPIGYNQPMLYSGFLFLFIAAIVARLCG